ncbi:MAG: putative motility protein [Oceanospirillales bacterium]|uniref:Putative motility protein YjfB-like n=1 Tax=Marinobacterium halophilum TaxID=267374 RepID=A0A2P8EVI3_9GAMM|nr:YjfB family protein [Marinobacterium halophilum]MBR9829848.1 putative motility protein [Oceanospirillales bacterium]PSL13469.1 putative motility protein YjfB-like [Marinobacterium halophilum]
MNIAGMSTAMSNLQTQTDHSVKSHNLAKDHMEMVGEQVMQLIDSVTPAVDLSSPLGQNINTRA